HHLLRHSISVTSHRLTLLTFVFAEMPRLSLFLALFLCLAALSIDAYVDMRFVQSAPESDHSPIMTIGRFREPMCQCCSSLMCRRKPCPCPRFPL
ncbi:hypothetical protein PMAYCL1PPCAC_30967, partial [Pristionchus mayeri]